MRLRKGKISIMEQGENTCYHGHCGIAVPRNRNIQEYISPHCIGCGSQIGDEIKKSPILTGIFIL